MRAVATWITLSLLSAGPAFAQPAPAAPDTARAEVHGPRGWPTPLRVLLWPEEPRFGAAAALIVDYPGEVRGFAVDSLSVSDDWLQLPPRAAGAAHRPWWRQWLSRTPQMKAPVAGAPPIASGSWRVAVPVRLYTTGPAQVTWTRGPATEAVQVRAGELGGSELAAIRTPRGLGWYTGRIVLAAVVLGVLAVGVRWLFRRLRPGERPRDRGLPVPAWMPAAIALWRLDQADLPARGEGHEFLDRLAGILRAYLAARFHLPAMESTAIEIALAARRAGWPEDRLRGFVKLIAAADVDRYAPLPIRRERCGSDLAQTLALIEAARFVPRYTPVPAALRVEAEAAWNALGSRYPGVSGRKVESC